MNSNFYVPSNEGGSGAPDLLRSNDRHKSMSDEEKLALIHNSYRTTSSHKLAPPPLHTSGNETASFLDKTANKPVIERSVASAPGQMVESMTMNDSPAQHLMRRHQDPQEQMQSIKTAFHRTGIDPIKEAQEKNRQMEMQAFLQQQRLLLQKESEEKTRAYIKYGIVAVGIGVAALIGYKLWSYSSELAAIKSIADIMQELLSKASENYQP